jgi:transposase
MTKRELTDSQWEKICPFLPQPKRSRRGGRPPADNRACLEGILWVLRSGARWKDLPGDFPSSSTCWRRLRDWEEAELWLQIWRTFLGELDAAGKLDWEETFADGSFAPAKKGARVSEKPNAARVRSGWWWETAKVFLWEFTWTRPPPTRSSSSRKH